MRRRKLRWVVALAGLALLASGAFVAWPRANRVTRENIDRIDDGMSRPEVEAILGPPGDCRTGPTDGELTVGGGSNAGGYRLLWRGDSATVAFNFDRNEKVTARTSMDTIRREPRVASSDTASSPG